MSGALVGDLPGLTIDSGPRGIAQQPDIRGDRDERIVLHVVGGRLTFSQGQRGRFFLDPAPLHRVEVGRGGGSTPCGPGAAGGVILFETVGVADPIAPDRTMAGRGALGPASNGDRFTASTTPFAGSGTLDAPVFPGTGQTGGDLEVGLSQFHDAGLTPPDAKGLPVRSNPVVDRDAEVTDRRPGRAGISRPRATTLSTCRRCSTPPAARSPRTGSIRPGPRASTGRAATRWGAGSRTARSGRSGCRWRVSARSRCRATRTCAREQARRARRRRGQRARGRPLVPGRPGQRAEPPVGQLAQLRVVGEGDQHARTRPASAASAMPPRRITATEVRPRRIESRYSRRVVVQPPRNAATGNR